MPNSERPLDCEQNQDFAIRIRNLSKYYEVYNQPSDRLKQFVIPRLRKIIGLNPIPYFNQFWALKDISFQVRKGETVGIIGRNGSGKSTLLQIICGTLHPSTGTVEVNGRVAALLELGAGFNPEFTGRENVYMNARVLGLSLEQTAERFNSIESFADIGDFIDQPVKSYSSGMMVRLAFAVIAHVDADILVIDEALAVGDVFFTQKCMRFLRNFMKSGTVLFVSHDTASVKNLCNEALWLEKGNILQQGDTKEVCELYLQAFFEAQQGQSTTTRLKELKKTDPALPLKDQRLEFINASNLRNDLEIFSFNPDASAFGQGGATITHVEFLDAHYEPLNWVVGGETVYLQISAHCHQNLISPIIGFFIKDKLGQELFGDNTFLSYQNDPLQCDAGQALQARFQFEMPRLAKGDYSVTVAIAEGTQHEHIQHHWIHDAIQFKSESNSVSGLIGIPMYTIDLEKLNS
ncbi:MAG: ABC transporter ATP-binding protein [Gammaproteobacteria bacterium]|nr:ABC transporter ATP-binding protein [Gammaproteobacteria bacterium]